MKTQLKTSKKLNKQSGANAVEYGLVLGVIVAFVMGGAALLEDPLDATFTKAADIIKALVGA